MLHSWCPVTVQVRTCTQTCRAKHITAGFRGKFPNFRGEEHSPEATEVDGLDALLAVDYEFPALPVKHNLRPPLAPLLERRDLLDHGVSESCAVNSNQVRFAQKRWGKGGGRIIYIRSGQRRTLADAPRRRVYRCPPVRQRQGRAASSSCESMEKSLGHGV